MAGMNSHKTGKNPIDEKGLILKKAGTNKPNTIPRPESSPLTPKIKEGFRLFGSKKSS